MDGLNWLLLAGFAVVCRGWVVKLVDGSITAQDWLWFGIISVSGVVGNCFVLFLACSGV